MILCTGYLHHYPHLADDLRYNGPGTLYPDLYKSTLMMKGGNNRHSIQLNFNWIFNRAAWDTLQYKCYI